MFARSRTRAVLTRALLILLLLSNQAAFAQAQPSGARVAPVTPKPWLVPLADTPTLTPAPTLAPAETNNEAVTPLPASLDALTDAVALTATPPPSSLNGWIDDFLPTASPVATPTEAALPGVLGLKDAAVFRVLLIGTDAYTLKEAGRSDTMILMQVNLRTHDIRMVSFLRDLYVKVPGHGKTRLNAAYVYGREALLRETLQDNFHVVADRTLAVNFSLMAELVDRIGGVEVEVTEQERKQLNAILKFYNKHNGYREKDQLLGESGVQCLTGKQALCFSRIRKIDSDFARVSRQRKVLEGIYRRVRAMDALTLAGILTDMLPKVKTDMTLADAVALIPTLMKMENVGFQELTIPVKTGYRSETISGMMVLVPDLAANQNAIEAFLQ